jgi:hypothetical protein
VATSKRSLEAPTEAGAETGDRFSGGGVFNFIVHNPSASYLGTSPINMGGRGKCQFATLIRGGQNAVFRQTAAENFFSAVFLRLLEISLVLIISVLLVFVLFVFILVVLVLIAFILFVLILVVLILPVFIIVFH